MLIETLGGIAHAFALWRDRMCRRRGDLLTPRLAALSYSRARAGQSSWSSPSLTRIDLSFDMHPPSIKGRQIKKTTLRFWIVIFIWTRTVLFAFAVMTIWQQNFWRVPIIPQCWKEHGTITGLTIVYQVSSCRLPTTMFVACSGLGQAKVHRLLSQRFVNDLLNLNESNALHKEKLNEGLRGIGGFDRV